MKNIPPPKAGVKQLPESFYASPFWFFNLWGAPILGFGGFSIITYLNYKNGDSPGPELNIFILVCAVATILAYFPGNLCAMWPYAVVVDPTSAITICGPFKKIMIPISEIGDIEDSSFWQGKVVHLTRPHVALTQFIIPWYFGSRRHDLIKAIESAVAQAEQSLTLDSE